MKNFIILILLTLLPVLSKAQEREIILQPSNFPPDIHKIFKERLGEEYPVDVDFIYMKQESKKAFVFVKMSDAKSVKNVIKFINSLGFKVEENKDSEIAYSSVSKDFNVLILDSFLLLTSDLGVKEIPAELKKKTIDSKVLLDLKILKFSKEEKLKDIKDLKGLNTVALSINMKAEKWAVELKCDISNSETFSKAEKLLSGFVKNLAAHPDFKAHVSEGFCKLEKQTVKAGFNFQKELFSKISEVGFTKFIFGNIPPN